MDELEKLKAEIEALHKQREMGLKFRDSILDVLNKSGHGLWEWNQESDLLLFQDNETYWLEILGYDPAEVDYSLGWWLENMHPDCQKAYTEALNAHISGQAEYFELEYRLKTKSGSWAWFWTRGTILETNDKGEPTRMFGVYNDITARKEAEFRYIRLNSELENLIARRTQELTAANRELKEEVEHRKVVELQLQWARQQAETANNSKTEFLANISHELRTPLHHILNYSKLGIKKQSGLSGKTEHYFSQIHSSSKRLQHLVDDLLDISSLELRKVSYRFNPVDIRSLALESAEELQLDFARKNINLKIQQPSTRTMLTCDKFRIKQVFNNLLSNAVKFSPKGSNVEILFDNGHLANNQENKPALKVMVVDEGVGIPEVEIERVFDAFIQSGRTKTGAGGTGLGLSICRQIISDHQGKIWASNNGGKGAVLSFLLPYQLEKSPEPPAIV